MALSLRPYALAWAPAVTLVVLACSSSTPVQDPAADPSKSGPGPSATATGTGAASAASVATASETGVAAASGTQTGGAAPGATQQQPPGPPTIETCRAIEKPAGAACSWALVSTHYCGGAPPRAEMLWPRCSCEACAVDADCPRGTHCATLQTDEECSSPKNICLGASSRCDEDRGCGKGQRCMWIAGKATCKVPTSYPPRP